MPLFLKERNLDVREMMDDPNCDREKLYHTYDQFTRINKLLGRWNSIYKNRIRPVIQQLDGKASILDIGSGGGDIISFLHSFTREDRFDVTFTGIDPDPRAIEYTNRKQWPDGIQFLKAISSDLIEKNQTFDIVISNHLLHHLSPDELLTVCTDATALSKKLVIFNDIERSDVGFTFFSLLSPLLFRNSFISADGITSIKRSYTKNELDKNLPENWSVHRQFPFRLLAIHQKQNHASG
ncbi:MAG: methyltransferase domain-containing protein [Balneolaceae bacterium]